MSQDLKSHAQYHIYESVHRKHLQKLKFRTSTHLKPLELNLSNFQADFIDYRS